MPFKREGKKKSEGRKKLLQCYGDGELSGNYTTEEWMQKGELSLYLEKRKLVAEMRAVFTYFQGNFVEELLILEL